jgi:hypothetical protein
MLALRCGVLRESCCSLAIGEQGWVDRGSSLGAAEPYIPSGSRPASGSSWRGCLGGRKHLGKPYQMGPPRAAGRRHRGRGASSGRYSQDWLRDDALEWRTLPSLAPRRSPVAAGLPRGDAAGSGARGRLAPSGGRWPTQAMPCTGTCYRPVARRANLPPCPWRRGGQDVPFRLLHPGAGRVQRSPYCWPSSLLERCARLRPLLLH